MCLRADMTFPEVEEIHVVDRRLPALDLKEHARLPEPAKVVGSEREFLVCEQALLLALEA